ncbi:hypothetical protein WJX72_001066 [[Myrmecia] bisecta]|uniref:Small-subunit processome Utp21 domain-containing protein n=1 Tax=[Myrmecia] bisecta TaxID=41462 RepID=A0AAW1QE69_9CHLO
MALFQPFRALGYITDSVPFAVQRRGRETYVTVSVGNAWQIYSCTRLQLVLVGPLLPRDICALASKRDFTFAAVGRDIIACQRVHRVGKYCGHSDDILQLLCLGDHLLSLGRDGKLLLWKIGEYDAPEVSIQLAEDFQPTCLAHPDTYLNKVAVGGREGKMQLWNFVSGRMLFEFSLGEADVQCITSSPALDVVGVGLADGRAVLYNIRYDEEVVTFANASGVGANSDLYLTGTFKRPAAETHACSCISFRTGAGIPLMAAGGSAGVVTVWNLEERRLHTIIKDAHDAPLTSLYFFPGEPLLMSAAGDNAVKQWLFDAADGTARLLRFRSGHSAPPTCLRHYGEGTRLLSAGEDRAFRMFSTIQDQQSRELSQHHTAKRAKRLKVTEQELKLPKVLAIDACQVRERDWCNVITAHEGDSAAYTWRLQHFTLGDHVLRPASQSERGNDGTDTPVSAVAMSRCGNFGLVGTQAGRIDRYNMQSGLHRGMYTRSPAEPGRPLRYAHAGPVTGLSSDACNKLMVSCGRDGFIRVWHFKNRKMEAEIDVGQPILKMCHHHNSGLLAVATDDLTIRMYDVEAGRLVRRFSGHKEAITDMVFSADCRWLLSSSMDGTVRVWDIPAAQVLQVVQLGSPVTALSFSPTSDMLATTHDGKRGIYLWSNSMVFGNSADIIPSDKPVRARLPTITTGREGGEVCDNEEAASLSDEDADMEDASHAAEPASTSGMHKSYEGRDASGAPQPLTPQLVTLSMLPRTQWQNLVHLDAIKARNKPIEPPKKPAAAPFFLPTVAGLQGVPVFDLEANGGEDEEEELPGWGTTGGAVKGAKGTRAVRSRVLKTHGDAGTPEFIRLLRQCTQKGEFTALVAKLRSMSPAAIDQELRGMQVVEGFSTAEDLEDLGRLLDCITAEVAANRNFEFMQALLRVVLQIHADTIMAQQPLRQRAEQLEAKLKATWTRVEDLLQNVRCMTSFFGNLPA